MPREIKCDGIKLVQEKRAEFKKKIMLDENIKENVDKYNSNLRVKHSKDTMENTQRWKTSKLKRKNAQQKGMSKIAKRAIAMALVIGIGVTAVTTGLSYKSFTLQELDKDGYESSAIQMSGISKTTIIEMMEKHEEMKEIKDMSIEELKQNAEEITNLTEQIIKEKLAKEKGIKASDIELNVIDATNYDPKQAVAKCTTGEMGAIKLNRKEANILIQEDDLQEIFKEKEPSVENIEQESIKTFNKLVEYTEKQIQQSRDIEK